MRFRYLYCIVLIITLAGIINFSSIHANNLKAQDKKECIDSLHWLSKSLRLTYPDSGFAIARETYKMAVKEDYKAGIYDLNNLLGMYYNDRGMIDEAFYKFTEALEIAQTLDDNLYLTKSYNFVGTAYWFLSDFTNALYFFKLSADMAQKLNKKDNLLTAFMNIGILNSSLTNYDSAFFYYEKSLEIAKEIGDTGSIAMSNLNIAGTLFSAGRFDESITSHLSAIRNYRTQYTPYIQSIIFNNLAGCYIQQRKYALASDYLDSTYYIARTYNILTALRDVYLEYYRLDSVLGNYDGAYEHLLTYSLYRDSISQQEIDEQINTYRHQFDIQQEEKKNELLRQNLQIDQLKNKRKSYITGLLALILTASVILMILFRKRKTKRHHFNQLLNIANTELTRSNKKLEHELQIKNNFFKLIAKEIQIPFMKILEITNQLDNKGFMNNEIEFNILLKNLYNSANDVYDLLNNLLIWARIQTNSIKFDPSVLNIQEIIVQANQLLRTNILRKGIKIIKEFSTDEDYLIMVDQQMLRTAITNLFTSFCKLMDYGNTLKIQIYKQKRFVCLRIAANKKIDDSYFNTNELTDPFQIFNPMIGKSSIQFSLNLAFQLISYNHGSLQLTSRDTRETEIEIVLPMLN